jgi:hypothetical protein
MDFERAGGMSNEDVRDLNVKCSEGRYLVVRFDFPDGTTLDGPDA